jgi:hypothetical protein
MYTLPKAGPSMAIHLAVLIAALLTYPIVKLINRITGTERLA